MTRLTRITNRRERALVRFLYVHPLVGITGRMRILDWLRAWDAALNEARK